MKINWNDFIEVALDAYPEEACGFLFSRKPYDPQEEWFVFSVENLSSKPLNSWRPNKDELRMVKKRAMDIGLTRIGNIHTHPYFDDCDIEKLLLPSKIDLSYAKRYNDAIRGIMVVSKNAIYGIKFHDKFGNIIPVELEEFK